MLKVNPELPCSVHIQLHNSVCRETHAAAHSDYPVLLRCASRAVLALMCGGMPGNLRRVSLCVRLRLYTLCGRRVSIHVNSRHDASGFFEYTLVCVSGAACTSCDEDFRIILPRHIMVLRVHLRARLGRCLLRGAARISGYSCLGTLGFIEYTCVRPKRCLLLGAEECAETLPRRTLVLRVHSCVPSGVCSTMRRVCT